MKTILGIDIGGTTTKIVGLDHTGALLSTLRVQAEDPVTSLYGAFGSYLTQNRLKYYGYTNTKVLEAGATLTEISDD